jgi:hypothetical protein
MDPSMNAKLYYNDMVKTTDELKVFQDFKKPTFTDDCGGVHFCSGKKQLEQQHQVLLPFH